MCQVLSLLPWPDPCLAAYCCCCLLLVLALAAPRPRGLVACANQNQPHSNGAQFFMTLAAADWLDKKNTIFGRVVGDTIYNLTRIGEVDVSQAPPFQGGGPGGLQRGVRNGWTGDAD